MIMTFGGLSLLPPEAPSTVYVRRKPECGEIYAIFFNVSFEIDVFALPTFLSE